MTTCSPVRIRKGKQLSVFLENELGALAALAELLGRRGINIYAITLTGGLDHSDVRIVADQPDAAAACLREAGHLIYERDVLLLDLPNQPGTLGRVTRQWAQAGINLEYAYCAGGPEVHEGLVVIRVDDPDRAMALLQTPAAGA